jgi:hypothetical protein
MTIYVHTGKLLDISRSENATTLRIEGLEKQVWIHELQKSLIKDLKIGEKLTLQLRPGRFYDFLKSVEWGEAVSQPPSARVSEGAAVTPKPPPKPDEITVSEPKLPDSIPELQQFILVTHEALKIYRTKLDAVNRLNVAQAIRNRTLEDGQKVGTALLWAEAKLGELLSQIPRKPIADSSSKGRIGGSERSLPEGITYKQSHYAQQLAEHKDLIEETIKEAVESEDIPTRTQVLQKVKMQEAPAKPEPLPREQWKDCGQFDCPVCKESYRLLHLSEGRHKLESVKVIEK